MRQLLSLIYCIATVTVNSQCIIPIILEKDTALECPADVALTLKETVANHSYYLVDSSGENVITTFLGNGADVIVNTGITRHSTTYKMMATSDTNQSVSLNGINENVRIPNNNQLRPTEAITIEAWINTANISTNRYYEIYRKEDGNDRQLFAFQEYGTILSFGLGTGGSYAELDVPIKESDFKDKWVHVAATYDGTTKRIYRNGVEIGSFMASGTMAAMGVADAYIGSSSGVGEFFHGYIDEFRIWNKARSATEIQDGMSCFGVDTTGLIVWFDMDTTAGNVVNDKSVNGLDATLLEGISTHSNPDPIWQVGAWQNASNTVTITLPEVRTYYVDQNATGQGTGLSWEDAFTNVIEAVTICTADTVKIAEGFYQEDTTIVIDRPLVMIGGYQTGGSRRNILQYPTYIDGNDNKRVITITPTYNNDFLYLDGLIIQNGRAERQGAGLYFDGFFWDLHITDCIIQHNTVRGDAPLYDAHGAGMFFSGYSLNMERTKIRHNRSDVLTNGSSNAYASTAGAYLAIHNLSIIDCEISYNSCSAFSGSGSAGSEAGGMRIHVGNGTTAKIVNTKIMHNQASASSNTENCTAWGGGIKIGGSKKLDIINTLIANNKCRTVRNNGGFASARGGGIFSGNEIRLINSTIASNSAENAVAPSEAMGGGIFQFANDTFYIDNSIVWGNAALSNSSYGEFGGVRNFLSADYSLIQGLNPTGVSNLNDIGLVHDPLFLDPTTNRFYLQTGSPCANAGSNTLLPLDDLDLDDDGDTLELIPVDLNQLNRIQSGTVDMGAYEQYVGPGPSTLYVNINADAFGAGNSWSDPLQTIDEAIHLSQLYTGVKQIWVAKGTYLPQTNLGNLFSKQRSFHIKNGIGLYGGFAGSETNLSQRDLITNSTILSGDLGEKNNHIDNVSHLVISVNDDSTTILDGFIIEDGGNSNSSSSALTIEGKVINAYDGAGIYLDNSNLQIRNTVFRNNKAFNGDGGAIYQKSGQPSIINSLFLGNEALNPSYGLGSAAYITNGSTQFTNCTFVKNESAFGIIAMEIADNLRFENSIAYDNQPGFLPDFFYSFTGETLLIDHSFIQGENPAGTNNINDADTLFNPMFTDTTNNDYTLSALSPLLNVGNVAYLPSDISDLDNDGDTLEPIPFDVLGNLREQDCAVDLGAYERKATSVPNIDNDTNCVGDESQLVGQGNALQWFDDALLQNNIHIGDTLEVTTSISGIDTFYVLDTIINCGLTLPDTVHVVTHDLPNVTAIATNSNVCEGEMITLNSAGAENYSWTGGIQNGISFIPTTSSTYQVTGIDTNNCMDTASVFIMVNDLPNVLASASDTIICAGETVTLTGSGASNYSWNNGIMNGESFVPSISDSYQITGTDDNNCSDTTSIFVEVHTIDTTVVLQSDTLMVVATEGTFQWLDCNNDYAPISGSNTNTFVPSSTGNYAVEIMQNGCVDTSRCYVFNGTGIFPNTTTPSFYLYPNPVKDQVNIILDEKDDNKKVQILNALGKVMVKTEITRKQHQVNLMNLEPGIYYLQIDQTIKRFVKL